MPKRQAENDLPFQKDLTSHSTRQNAASSRRNASQRARRGDARNPRVPTGRRRTRRRNRPDASTPPRGDPSIEGKRKGSDGGGVRSPRGNRAFRSRTPAEGPEFEISGRRRTAREGERAAGAPGGGAARIARDRAPNRQRAASHVRRPRTRSRARDRIVAREGRLPFAVRRTNRRGPRFVSRAVLASPAADRLSTPVSDRASFGAKFRSGWRSAGSCLF